jgi:hypothetical protein
MSPILWIIIAMAIAGVWSLIAVRRTQRIVAPNPAAIGEPVPSTPMQRVAWQGLVPTLLCIAVAAVIVAQRGVVDVWNNDAVRATVTLFLIVALGGYTYFLARLRAWLIKDNNTLDERDRAILAAAPAGQAPAMMVVLAAWMIYLTETFHDAHLVPSAYLYAMFWSVLLTSIVASLLGVLIGYRRS